MFDHVLSFEDRDSAISALSGTDLVGLDADGVLHFDNARCVPVRLITEVGDIDASDPENPIALPDTILPGFHLVVALLSISQELIGLPGNACRIVADREAANAGSPDFIKYIAPDTNLLALANIVVSPSFAGSAYPFGNLPTP